MFVLVSVSGVKARLSIEEGGYSECSVMSLLLLMMFSIDMSDLATTILDLISFDEFPWLLKVDPR